MEKTSMEELFEQLDAGTEAIVQHAGEPYLDALGTVLDCLFFGEVPEEFDDLLAHRLKNIFSNVVLDDITLEDRRKAVQLAILKGMKDSTQDKHLMTPEAIALFVSYLTEKFLHGREDLRVFDPAGGTGNLLTAVLDRLPKDTKGYAAEIDPTLIRIALANANIQEKNIEFFHQDALRPLLLDPVDLVVGDLPVGYYPGDASDYKLKADDGHSYAHHLFIETGLRYCKPGGYCILLVPDFLFESDQAGALHKFIHEEAFITGLLRLPETAFKSKKHVKSIFILQKKGNGATMPKQPLLAQLPSLKNAQAMANLLSQVDAWFKTYNEEREGAQD
ncbi:class I SAM-dependent methyltransferase [Aciduricibacillus chroicocephali]|uniref:Class I SAM-dependent methyltransferase n=1 Tax=Aciduricibacillus chroicocephali TaxID=3054939 RepID=A0ABY9KS98_9BACI|nr:class I SAM-dependent methyltransferase [Bacillaceae bacterium 44XB]